ncbi:MAG: aminotransferase class I/II-fold pyridoxal phosphate-dependent enzyme [Chitinophagaceae bacterium]|nr:MAG: aminotransferase class I/II-fold pyridoxal phosphate-dependent enzyme [Chitinophagaceae bacterium]
MQIHSKLPDVGTTIFTVMSGLATELNAVNLGQGFPDFSMDFRLTELVNQAMAHDFNQYAPMPGWLPLREALAEKNLYLYGARIDPVTEITVTPGGTYAIYTALTSILKPGDEVIVLEPSYDSYVPNIIVNGAKPILVSLKLPDYRIDWEAVKRAVTTKTKAIIINSPHNPTGTVLYEDDIVELRSLVHGTGIFIVSDEVYEHLIYDGAPHLSMLKFPDLRARSFVCFSFGKVFHCTGWKLGYCIAPPGFTVEFRKVHQFNCFSCHTPSQVAIGKYLTDRSSYLDLGKQLQAKRDYFLELMKSTRFTMKKSAGSYFICASYERISDEEDKSFVVRITKEFGVAMIPVSAFYQEGKDDRIVRFCFAKKEQTLERAVEKLARL